MITNTRHKTFHPFACGILFPYLPQRALRTLNQVKQSMDRRKKKTWYSYTIDRRSCESDGKREIEIERGMHHFCWARRIKEYKKRDIAMQVVFGMRMMERKMLCLLTHFFSQLVTTTFSSKNCFFHDFSNVVAF